MGEDGRVVYRIVFDNADQFVNEAARAGQEAGDAIERGGSGGGSRFEEIMIGVARRIGEAFVDMAAKAVQGVQQIVQAGIEFNAKMETYETAFTTLLGSAEEAQRVMSQIREDAASTPFDVDSLTQANQALISAGVSADQARTDILNLANAIAATGGGSAELQRMAANLQQIQNTGKATAMDIRQFANAGINIFGLLADSMGITTEQAAQMDVTYEDLAAAFAHAAESGGVYENALQRQSETFTGRISTLKDNATQLAGALTEDIFSQLSGTALPMVMDWVSQLLEAAETGGVSGAIDAAKEIISTLVTNFLNKLPELLNTGLRLLESLLSGIGTAIPKVVPIVTQVIIALTTALMSHISDIILAGIDLLLGLVTGLLTAIPDLLAALPTIISTLLTGLISHLPELVSAGIQLLIAVGTGLIQAIPQILAMLPEIFMAIIQAFGQVDWASIGSAIVEGIWQGIQALWSSLVNAVVDAARQLWASVKSFFGIASPSKKFKYIGEMSVEGMQEGFEEGQEDLTRTVHNVYTGVMDAVGGESGARTAESMAQSVSYSLAATGTTGGATIVVPLSIDGREIARATAWSMGEQLAWEEL